MCLNVQDDGGFRYYTTDSMRLLLGSPTKIPCRFSFYQPIIFPTKQFPRTVRKLENLDGFRFYISSIIVTNHGKISETNTPVSQNLTKDDLIA